MESGAVFPATFGWPSILNLNHPQKLTKSEEMRMGKEGGINFYQKIEANEKNQVNQNLSGEFIM